MDYIHHSRCIFLIVEKKYKLEEKIEENLEEKVNNMELN